MPPLDCYYTIDIERGITAGAKLALVTAQAQQTTDIGFLTGVLAMAQHQATLYGIEWPTVSGKLRAALVDAGRADLLDAVGRVAIGEG